MYLGVRVVFALSFARIHWANLLNFGILPVTFERQDDYASLEQGDELEMPNVREAVRSGNRLEVINITKNQKFVVSHSLSPRQVDILLAGGLLNYIKAQA
jgi:aconitate hydratase